MGGFEAVILAGGAGTRLRSVVSDLPKPMAGVAGRPFLAYQLDYLVASGASRLILSVGYRREKIMEHFGDRYAGVPVSYVVEEEPLGTGGAIRESLRAVCGESALILNGDTFFPVDLNGMLRTLHANGCGLVMAVKELFRFDRYGTVVMVEDRITGFRAKGFCERGYINGGIYAVTKAIAALFPARQAFSFEADFLEQQVGRIGVVPFCSDAYFIDIGIPEDYQRAQHELPLQGGEKR
ncbi:nucleotidyltransferase family protein [Trichlorobacter lovleyi]|uniref:nucleotidyltransferase family protein n=1 Tax=Trichlorobacter lovleyi TaxID=313985 RepID=UPI003D0F6DBA